MKTHLAKNPWFIRTPQTRALPCRWLAFLSVVMLLFASRGNAGVVVVLGGNNYGVTDVPVAAQSGVMAIGSGDDHAAALKADGAVVAWGAGPSNTGSSPNYGISAANATGTGPAKTVSRTSNEAPQPPTINTPPASGAVCPGSSVTLFVTASGTGTLTYQWRRNTTALPGQTGQALTVAAAEVNPADSYDVVVSNEAGSITSSAVAITLNVPAAITTQPVAVSVAPGAQAVFTVAVTGTPAPTLQWYRGTVLLTGQTGTTLTVNNVQLANVGDYSVVVANACQTETSAAVALTVNGPVEITQAPQSQTVRVGETATFRVVAAGTPPLSYQWRRNGTPIPSATTETLTLASVPITEDQTTYDVVVSNLGGAAPASPSPAARLTVVQPPVITRAPQSVTVLPGTTVTFSVEATGSGPLSYQWKKDGAPISGATSASYTVANAQTANIGAYTVVVSNAQSSEERTALLNVVSRQLKVGDVQVNSPALGAEVSVPVTLVGDGTEKKVAFSVAFDPAVLAYVRVEGAPEGATVTVIPPSSGGADVVGTRRVIPTATSTGGNLIGVTVELPGERLFPAGASMVAAAANPRVLK